MCILIILLIAHITTAKFIVYPRCSLQSTDSLKRGQSIVVCEPQKAFSNITLSYTLTNQLPTKPTITIEMDTSAGLRKLGPYDGETATVELGFDTPTTISKITITNRNLIADITSIRTELNYLVVEPEYKPVNVKLAVGLTFGTIGIFILIGSVTLVASYIVGKRSGYEGF